MVLAGPAVAGVAQPALPADVSPLPAELAGRIAELTERAEKHRGLKALRPVPAGRLSPEVVEQKLEIALDRDIPPAKLAAVEAALKAFGLIPEPLDLRRYLPRLLGSQVAGFYDPDERYLALVELPGQSLAEEGASEETDIVLIHELTHALQDQHFDLKQLATDDPLSDAVTAREALVEGDATLTMMSAMLGDGAKLPTLEQLANEMAFDAAELASWSTGPQDAELRAAPAFFRQSLLFGYLQGYQFCVSVRKKGGQKLLDHAFAADPPRSSEQILHPEKWHTRRDDPVAVTLPDLAAELPGAAKLAEGDMGELGVAIVLEAALGDRRRAAAAAAGWGGDRFAVYGNVYGQEEGRILVWVTEWDDEREAAELRAAARRLGRGWTVSRAGPRRVVLLRGLSERARRNAVVSRLLAPGGPP
jgi:hypothetical protein